MSSLATEKDAPVNFQQDVATCRDLRIGETDATW